MTTIIELGGRGVKLLNFKMYLIKTTFIEFLMPENIGIETKMMIIQLLYAEVWPKVGSQMTFLGFVVTENNDMKANEMAK
jgi:hypothetical protein